MKDVIKLLFGFVENKRGWFDIRDNGYKFVNLDMSKVNANKSQIEALVKACGSEYSLNIGNAGDMFTDKKTKQPVLIRRPYVWIGIDQREETSLDQALASIK
tara:strand:- start:156 stop:461 length:306 start_codon:yes stop_codon:yes gene_type:complete